MLQSEGYEVKKEPQGQDKESFHTLVATNKGDKWFFVFGFAKNIMKKSKILETVHETAIALHKTGVMDQITLREFDLLCLPKIENLDPEQIKAIREASQVSQAVFAALLNTSVSTVQKWEIGQKRPSGTALKLLHIVDKHGLDAILI